MSLQAVFIGTDPELWGEVWNADYSLHKLQLEAILDKP